MTSELQSLIQALRQELQAYGGLLALLEQQRASIDRQQVGEILSLLTEIDWQSARVRVVRDQRCTAQQRLALQLQLSPAASLGEMLPRLPEQYRPLVAALVQENNQLLRRARLLAQENHAQLQRSLEWMQRFVRILLTSDDGGEIESPADRLLSSIHRAELHEALP